VGWLKNEKAFNFTQARRGWRREVKGSARFFLEDNYNTKILKLLK